MNKCRHAGCGDQALALFDLCWKHLSDKDAYRRILSAHIAEKGSVKGFYLRYLEFPDAQWQGIDAEDADLAGADLTGADMTAANLKKINLTGAKLHKANLASADLDYAHLLKCDLSGARLWSASIRNANLAESDLSSADFLKSTITNAKLWHVRLDGAKFLAAHNFIGKHPIDESGALSASEAYRDLKQYFTSSGRYDDASWASFKEKQLERVHLLESRKILSYFPSLVMSILCGYGERPARVVVSAFSVIFIYASLYWFLNILRPVADAGPGGYKIWDFIYFSFITFTTVGFGDLTVKLVPAFQMLVASEAFFGCFMMGLFVFTLARKYSAR